MPSILPTTNHIELDFHYISVHSFNGVLDRSILNRKCLQKAALMLVSVSLNPLDRWYQTLVLFTVFFFYFFFSE